MFKTRITELFGIEYPIIQGGMQWLGRAPMAAAVSNAGGLGIMTCASFDGLGALRDEIKLCKSMTDKPFALNVNLFPTVRPVPNEAYIEVIADEGVKIVESSGRSPEALMPLLKQAGITVIHKVAGARFAQTAERVGCDAVTIVGYECGGHPSMDDMTSLVLTPLTVDAVSIPVVAGGGFADARGLVTALALGAEGVLMGTRFMATKECPVHDNIKRRVVESGEGATVITLRSLRNNDRVLKNQVSLKVLEMEKEGASLEDLLPYISGLRGKQALEEGDAEGGHLSVGQVSAIINDVPTVKELIDGIITEAQEIIHRLGGLVPAPAEA